MAPGMGCGWDLLEWDGTQGPHQIPVMLSKPCNVLFLLWRVRPPDRRKSKAKGRGSTQAPGSPSQSPSSSPNLPNMGGVWSPGSNPPSPSLRSPSRNSTTPSPPHGLLGTGSGGEWRLILMVPVGLPTMIDVCPPCNLRCTRCHLYVCASVVTESYCAVSQPILDPLHCVASPASAVGSL